MLKDGSPKVIKFLDDVRNKIRTEDLKNVSRDLLKTWALFLGVSFGKQASEDTLISELKKQIPPPKRKRKPLSKVPSAKKRKLNVPSRKRKRCPNSNPTKSIKNKICPKK